MSWKDNISFVLVEPKEAGNIGAAARALKSMGFERLELVRPRTELTDEARCMACNAVDILEKTEIHRHLGDVTADKSLVVGTTRRRGRQRGIILPLKNGIRRIIARAGNNRVAILFGREEKGLHNSEVDECAFLLTIPTDPASPSLNLAQSIMIVAYELSTKTYAAAQPKMATQSALTLLYEHMQSALRLLEYAPRGNRDLETRILRNLRRVIGRAGLTDSELRMLHGICAQVGKKLQKKS